MQTSIHRILHFLQATLLTRRGLLILAGIFVFVYAVIVLFYVQSIPDIGVRSAFSPAIKGQTHPVDGDVPQEGDVAIMVGDIAIKTWADLLNAPFHLRDRLQALGEGESVSLPAWAKRLENGTTAVQVVFARKRPDPEKPASFISTTLTSWFVLGKLPLEDLVPSILWFILEVMLFSVGALVLWKRPTDNAAAQFFLLCIVTLGAYMGGYHWSHIATKPALLLIFMVCAVLLPVVSLHFFLVFPRKKKWLESRPAPDFFDHLRPAAPFFDRFDDPVFSSPLAGAGTGGFWCGCRVDVTDRRCLRAIAKSDLRLPVAGGGLVCGVRRLADS